jgi:TPR repeat protein
MKPRTPGFWLIVATVGLLALLPMQALAGMTPEEVRAFKQYEAAAKQGDLVAQNSLGLCYYFGRGVAKDYVQAVNLWRKGANQGDAYAQHLLAHRYATGEGVAKDSLQAVNLWRKSAAQGNAKAQFELGNSYATGEGVAKDTVEAAKWYRKSADQGYAAATKSLDSLNRKTPSKGTPPTETTVTTLDGVRVIITKKGNVTNIETVGNLSPNSALTGSTLAEIKPENNPVDLLARAVELFPQNHRAAYQLGLAARLRAQFDQKRVADRTAQQAFSVLTMQPDNERVLSWGGGSQTIGAEDHQAVLAWARKSGPPTYHPAWMIQHGMGVFGASSRAGAGLNADFVAASAWSQVLDDYAKFIDTPTFWVTRHERNNPANFPTLLKAMESRYLSELDSGPAGEIGRQKLRAVVVGFDLKATDPALALLDARDDMQAIVATPNSAAPASEVKTPLAEVMSIQELKAKAVKGDRGAQRDLAMAYGEGEGVAQDYAEAAKWFRKAAELGDMLSQFATGSNYEQGKGVAKDLAEALRWYRKAADQGYARAQFNVGNSYYHGLGVTRNYAEAIKWYRTCAEEGDVLVAGRALYGLGFCHANGQGVTKNLVEAYAHYDLAGATVAEARAGLLDLGSKLTADQLAAAKKRSAALQKELSDKLRLKDKTAKPSQSVTPASAEPAKVPAPEVTKTMAEQRDAYAQYRMGYRYANGDGVEKNLVESLKWYRKAAENGQVEAQYRLGFIYEQGRGVPVDYVESASWWRKAADQGHAGAQFSLGYCYGRGEGVPRNPSEAVKWFRKSADQGNASAYRFLGIAYERGQGVGIDKVEAYAYLTLALPGDSYAGGLLDSMTRGMTPSAIQKGKLRAKELQKEIEAKIAAKKARK